MFHEGNVSKSQRTLIRFVSGIPLAFVDIGEIFGPFQNQSISKEPHAAGYSLMCRFMYLQVWEYLRNFEIVARVDDDCRIVSLPMRLEGHSVFQGGVLLDDSHGPTNESLPSVLGPDRVKYWHNQIVNTCVYVTRVSFWTETMVQRYLQEIGEHDLALEKRWGDHRVLGIALLMFGKWSAEISVVNRQIDYFHQSHNQRIRNGSPEYLGQKKTLISLILLSPIVRAADQKLFKLISRARRLSPGIGGHRNGD